MNILIRLSLFDQEIMGCFLKNQNGQAIIETFILTSTFLLVLFFGTIQIAIICFNIFTASEAVFMSNRSAVVQKDIESAKRIAEFSCFYILSNQISKDNIFYYDLKIRRENSMYVTDLTYYQKVMFLGRYFYKGILRTKMSMPSSSDFLERAYPGAKKWEE